MIVKCDHEKCDRKKCDRKMRSQKKCDRKNHKAQNVFTIIYSAESQKVFTKICQKMTVQKVFKNFQVLY